MPIQTTQSALLELSNEERMTLADKLEAMGETLEIVDEEISHEKEPAYNDQVHSMDMDAINEAQNTPQEEKSFFGKLIDGAKKMADNIALPINDSIQKNQDAFIKPLVENNITKPYIKAVEDSMNFATPVGEFDFASQYDKETEAQKAIDNNDPTMVFYNKMNKLSRKDYALIGDKEQALDEYESDLNDVVIKAGFDELLKDEDGSYYGVRGEDLIELNSNTGKAILSELYGDKGEVGGAIIGAKKFNDATKGMGKKTQAIATLVGGGLGAMGGNALDMFDTFLETGQKLNATQVGNELLKAGALDVGAGAITAGAIKGAGAVGKALKDSNVTAKRAESYKKNVLKTGDEEVAQKATELEGIAKDFGGNENQELTKLATHDETQKVLSDMYDQTVDTRRTVAEDNQTLTDNLHTNLNIKEIDGTSGEVTNSVSKAISEEISGINNYWDDLYSQTRQDIVTIAGNENIQLQPSVVSKINKNINSLKTIENVQKRNISSEGLSEFEKDYSSMLDLISANLKQEVEQADGTIIKDDVNSYTLTGMMDLQRKFNDFFYKHSDKLTNQQKKNLSEIKTSIYDDIETYIGKKFGDDSARAKEVTDKWKSVNEDYGSWIKTKGRFKVLDDVINGNVDINTLTKDFISKNGDIDRDGLSMLGNVGFQLSKTNPEKLDEFYGAIVNNMLDGVKIKDAQFGKDMRYIDFEEFNKLYDSLKGTTLNKTFGQTKRGKEILNTLDTFRTLSKNEEKIQNAVLKKATPLSESSRTTKDATRDFLFGVAYAIRHRLLGFISKRVFKSDAFHSIVTDMGKKRRYSSSDFSKSIDKLKVKNEKLPTNKKLSKEEIDELVKIRTEIEEFEAQRRAEYKEIEKKMHEVSDLKQKFEMQKKFHEESKAKAEQLEAKMEYEAQRSQDMALDYQLPAKPQSKSEAQIVHESGMQNPNPKKTNNQIMSDNLDKANGTPNQIKLNQYKKNPYYDEVMSNAENTYAKETKYEHIKDGEDKFTKENLFAQGNENGYVKTPASYTKNEKFGTTITRQDFLDVQNGKVSDDLINRLNIELEERAYYEELAKQTDTDARVLSDAEVDKQIENGTALFANGKILGSGFVGGAGAGATGTDINGDGVVDELDVMLGAISGVVGFSAMKKMFPKAFMDSNLKSADAIAGSLVKKNEIERFGRNYSQFKNKPKEAIEHLMKVQNGQVRGALYHPDIGEIDVIWGKVTDTEKHSGYGLSHIIDKHGEEVARKLDDIVMGGKVSKMKGNTVELENNDFNAIIKLDWKKDEKIWVVTAFDTP